MALLGVGVWLTVAPFALGYRSAEAETDMAATVNDTLTGVLVVTLALFCLLIPGPRPYVREGSARR